MTRSKLWRALLGCQWFRPEMKVRVRALRTPFCKDIALFFNIMSACSTHQPASGAVFCAYFDNS